MENYILLSPLGNTYCGAIASRAMHDKNMRVALFNINGFLSQSTDNKFWVYELCHDAQGDFFVARAGQSTLSGARAYMKPNRVLVCAAENYPH